MQSIRCIVYTKVMPYAFGDYIRAEAWLNTNPSDLIKIKHLLLQMLYFLAPQTGLEPVTPRLTAACSTDWAIKAKYRTTLEKLRWRDVGIALSSRAASSQVLSALMSLTAVFGMGTGGPSSLKTPTALNEISKALLLPDKSWWPVADSNRCCRRERPES